MFIKAAKAVRPTLGYNVPRSKPNGSATGPKLQLFGGDWVIAERNKQGKLTRYEVVANHSFKGRGW